MHFSVRLWNLCCLPAVNLRQNTDPLPVRLLTNSSQGGGGVEQEGEKKKEGREILKFGDSP